MAIIRQPKSVEVPQEIRDWLLAYRGNFRFEADFNREIGVSREVTARVATEGTCSPFSLKIIKRAYNKKTESSTAA